MAQLRLRAVGQVRSGRSAVDEESHSNDSSTPLAVAYGRVHDENFSPTTVFALAERSFWSSGVFEIERVVVPTPRRDQQTVIGWLRKDEVVCE